MVDLSLVQLRGNLGLLEVCINFSRQSAMDRQSVDLGLLSFDCHIDNRLGLFLFLALAEPLRVARLAILVLLERRK